MATPALSVAAPGHSPLALRRRSRLEVHVPGELLLLLGFSGTSILSVNLTVHRYFVPLALLGAAPLLFSLASTAASRCSTCALRREETDRPASTIGR